MPRAPCALFDRLVAALLPEPPAAADAPAGEPSAANFFPLGTAGGGSAPAAAAAAWADPEEAEAHLRKSLVRLGVLREAESAPPLRCAAVDAELAAAQRQLHALARANARKLAALQHKKLAGAPAETRRRLTLAAAARVQKRYQKRKQKLAPPPAPKSRRRRSDAALGGKAAPQYGGAEAAAPPPVAATASMPAAAAAPPPVAAGASM